MKKLILILSTIFSTTAFAEVCELPKAQVLELWPFEVNVVSKNISWEAVDSAADLLRKQVKYFNDKDSPFAKNGVKAQLGFYNPGISVEIEAKHDTIQTLAGKDCSMTTALVLNIKQDALIQLPKELTKTSCVAQNAMKFQRYHHQLVGELLDSINTPEGKKAIKELVFPVYQYKGAFADNNQKSLKAAQKRQDDQASGAVVAAINSKIFKIRKIKTQNPRLLNDLFESCNGEYIQTSERVKQ